MPTTFVLEQDGDRVGFVYGDPFEVVYGGPGVETVEYRTLLTRDAQSRGPAPDGDGGYAGTMVVPATGPQKASELAVALVDRTDLPLSLTELDGEAAAEARTALREQHPTVFRDRTDIPLGKFYRTAKVEELATDLDMPEERVDEELDRLEAEQSSTRGAVQAMREAHGDPLSRRR
jgi:hypothetical protein